MHFFTILTCYLAGALMLVIGAFLGLAVLASPVESTSPDGSRATLSRKLGRDAAGKILAEPRPATQAFRYGPDVNHGRGDTPVAASVQALRDAKAAAPAKRKQPDHPGIVTIFSPILTSGH